MTENISFRLTDEEKKVMLELFDNEIDNVSGGPVIDLIKLAYQAFLKSGSVVLPSLSAQEVLNVVETELGDVVEFRRKRLLRSVAVKIREADLIE